MRHPDVQSFFHASTATWTHVVADPASGAAAVVDPVLDFDIASGELSTTSADALIAHIEARGLKVAWLLETHAHADHVSAGAWLRERIGGALCIGAGIVAVQRTFQALLDLQDGFVADGSQFDRLLHDGDRLALGALELTVLATPGHTGDSLSYQVGDALFVGDTLFSPTSGSARCDFPGGDAATLHRSVMRFYTLPDATRVFLCHDYPPAGGEALGMTTIAAQKAHNSHLRADTSEAEFVALRRARDATLAVPRLLYPAIQLNLRGGGLPPARANGKHYLNLPVRWAAAKLSPSC